MENISFPDFNEYLKERFTPSVKHSTFAEARTGTRVCCLYRVSTEKQVDHDSNDEPDIPMQRIACHRFCEQKGWTIVFEEQEDGVSGHKVRAEKRDVIQVIKARALNNEFDILLVFMFDRIGRISDETPFVVEWFARHGVHVWSVKEGEQRFDTHNDRLMNYIRFWAADGESEKTSIRTSTRLGQITEDGHFTGGVCPYGYKLVRLGRVNKKGHDLFDLAINEEEAAIVVFIFKKCAIEGKGAQSIANLLNQMGVKNRAGKNWHPSSVRNILRNIMYVGILRSGAYHSDIIPELQIITPELFLEVQEIIYQRSNAYEKQRRIPRNTRGQSLLAGNVFCGHCGARLCLTTNGKGRPRADGTDTVRIRYTCQTKSRKHEPCDGQTGYTLSILDGMIDDIIRQVLRYVKSVSKAEILATGYQTQMGEQKAIVNKAQRECEKARKDLQVLNAEIVNALTGNSAFTPDMLKEAIVRAEEKCAVLERDYEVAKKTLDNSEAYLAKLSTRYDRFVEWSDIYDAATIETKKMIVSQIIEKVEVFRDYHLKIKFTISVEQFILGLDISA